jgi:two-component system cell cycle sensor histidine kinase/response regulator CckA
MADRTATSVTRPIRVLHLEDNPLDAELVQHKLDAEGLACDILRVDSQQGFESALAQERFDLIISDFNLPNYDGIRALTHAQVVQPETPVIIISGTMGEEEAVRCLHIGATDYLLKERLDRLAPAVRRAIHEAEAQRKRKETEDALRQREQSLRENEARTSFALAAAGMGVWEIVSGTNRLTWSSTMASVFGLSPEHTPTTSEEFFRLVHPDDRDEVERSASRALRGETASYMGEFRTLWPDGSLHWVDGRAQLSYDADGRPLYLRGVCIDITAKKSLEAQLRQAQRMEAIGQLAGGIAHDFNNLLTVINGIADLDLARARPDSELRRDLQEIRDAGQKAATLTQQLLAFSRRQILQPQVINLNTVVHEMENIVRRVIGEDINLLVIPSERLGSIKADRGQIEQVIANLVLNARDAMPHGGKLTIETQNVDIDPAYARDHNILVDPGAYSVLVVSDDGTGMDDATRRRIFEPFFTTKDPGKGTGLGLSTVYGIVKQSNGFIWVYSEVGAGTSFKVYLPLVEGVVSDDRRSPTVVATHGTETILIVEDLAGLRSLVRRMLESAGYTVLTAASGDQAVLLMENYKDAVQLMVTDVVMPGMSGRKLAERLERTRPGMKVLYMSGYTDDVVVRNGVLEAGMPFLGKPFTAAALLRKVREILDAEPVCRPAVPAELAG